MFLPLSPWWGIATYWEHCSYGTIDLKGSEIFPWRKLNGFPTPTSAGMYGRGAIAAQAIAQGRAEGWPLDDFQGVVVWVAPSMTFPQDAGSSPDPIDGKAFCTLYEGSRHDFYTHEFGHTLRFVHPWGPSGNAMTPDLPYRDPYCVMSAMGYAGTQPVFAIPADPDGPPAGQIFWSSLPPMPAAATMYVTVRRLRNVPKRPAGGNGRPRDGDARCACAPATSCRARIPCSPSPPPGQGWPAAGRRTPSSCAGLGAGTAASSR